MSHPTVPAIRQAIADIEAELALAETAVSEGRRRFQAASWAHRMDEVGGEEGRLSPEAANLEASGQAVKRLKASRAEAQWLLAQAEADERAAVIQAANAEIADLFDRRVAIACQIDGAMKSVVGKIKDLEDLNARIRALRAQVHKPTAAGLELDRASFRRRLGRYLGLWLARFDGLGNLGFWRGHGTAPTPLAVSEALGRDRVLIDEPEGARHDDRSRDR